MSISSSDLKTETELRLTPNISLYWTKTKKKYPQPGIYNLVVEYLSLDNSISCFLGDYPNKKDWRKKIMQDIREVAAVLDIKIPAKLSLQAVKI